MHQTAETAPPETPILVFVSNVDVLTGKSVGWRMGRCYDYEDGSPKVLAADGLNGDWTILYWHPLPKDPE